MRLVVACLLVFVAVALAEPALIKDKRDSGVKSVKSNGYGNKPISTHKSSSSHRSSSRSSSSSANFGDAKAIARQLLDALPTSNGSAFFKRGKIDKCTIAEAPPKGSKSSSSSSSRLSSSARGSSQKSGSSKSSKSESSKSKSGSSKSSSSKSGSSKSSSSKSGSSKSSSSKSGSSKSSSSKSGSSKSSSSKSGSSSSSSSGICKISSPLKRPLFGFRAIPKEFNGVGLRKKYFMEKHHSLVVRFANEHKAVLTVVVINRHDQGKVLRIKNLRNKNLFVFTKDLKQIFPNSASQSSSHRRSSSASSSKRSPFDKQENGFKNKMNGLKDKMKSMFKPKNKF